jgi:hypothetical protein
MSRARPQLGARELRPMLQLAEREQVATLQELRAYLGSQEMWLLRNIGAATIQKLQLFVDYLERKDRDFDPRVPSLWAQYATPSALKDPSLGLRPCHRCGHRHGSYICP